MGRNLSTAARKAIFAQETEEEFVLLLTITQTQLPAPIYLAGYPYNIWSEGIEYLAAGFRITLPQEIDDRPPEVSIEVDNVDRAIVDAVRIAQTPPSVSLKVVLQASPNTIEAGPFDFTLKSASWDALIVSGRLTYENILDAPYPGDVFGPTTFPGLF